LVKVYEFFAFFPMGCDGLWSDCAYQYASTLKELFKRLCTGKPAGWVPELGIDVRIGYHRAVNNDTDFMFHHHRSAAARVLQRYKPLQDAGFRLRFVDDNPLGTLATPSKLRSFARAAAAEEASIHAQTELSEFHSTKAQLDHAQRENRSKAVFKLLKETAKVSSALADEFRDLVNAAGNDLYVRAPHQADPQLVADFLSGLVVGVVSPDGDLLIHGAPWVIKDFTFDGECTIASLDSLPWAGPPKVRPKQQVAPTPASLFIFFLSFFFFLFFFSTVKVVHNLSFCLA
jgi:hypothetical protein